MVFQLVVLWASLFVNISEAPVVKDSFEIKETHFHGYIMPSSDINFGDSMINFRPGHKQVQKAENFLQRYISGYRKNSNENGFDVRDVDAVAIKNLDNYFRQYTGFVNQKNHHRCIYILMISPEYREERNMSFENLKETWLFGVFDGGPILFHALIDLDSGVLYFHDNGSA